MADSGAGGPPSAAADIAEAPIEPTIVTPDSDPLEVIRSALQLAQEEGEEGTGYGKLLKRLKDLGKAEAAKNEEQEDAAPDDAPLLGQGHLDQLFAQLTSYARLTR